MGRDKAPKAAPAEAKPAEQPHIGLDGKPLRPPKGHKQRGAGTVITAKAPIVTTDGIVLKAHERLPSQLLQEYCQREKRPTPKYEHSPPGHRFNVVLADIKNSKNDLNFCPVQSFESDKLAKDYSALLALWHFQKSLPLERKLPEPFASTWTQMIAAEKEAQASSKGGAKASSASSKGAGAAAAGGGSTSASGKPPPPPPAAASTEGPSASTSGANLLLSAAKPAATTPAAGTGGGASSDTVTGSSEALPEETGIVNPVSSYAKNSGKPSSSGKSGGGGGGGGKLVVGAIELDKNTADWLCDSCGNQNFAKLASGVPRVKCFKCQTPKTDSCTLVASATAVAAAVAAATASASGKGGSSGGASGSGSSSASTAAAAVAVGGVVIKKMRKEPPSAVLDLRNKSQFASKADAERKLLEETTTRKRKNAYFDALRRANRPTAVLLSPNMRRMLETVLNLPTSSTSNSSEVGGGEGSSAVTVPMTAEELEGLLAVIDSDGVSGVEEVCALSASDQGQSVRSVVALLRTQGFSDGAIGSAVGGVCGNPDALLDELSATVSSSSPLTGTASSAATATAANASGKGSATKIQQNSSSKSSQSQFSSSFQEACLEYLCLYVDEASLPQGYDARSNEGRRTLAVVPTGASGKTQAKPPLPPQPSSSSSSDKSIATIGGGGGGSIATAGLKRLVAYGWSEDDCKEAIALVQNVLLLGSCKLEGGGATSITTSSTAAAAEATAEVEVEVLSGTPDSGTVQTLDKVSALVILWLGAQAALINPLRAVQGVSKEKEVLQQCFQRYAASLKAFRSTTNTTNTASTANGTAMDDSEDNAQQEEKEEEGAADREEALLAEAESLVSIFPDNFTHTKITFTPPANASSTASASSSTVPKSAGRGDIASSTVFHIFSLRLSRIAGRHPVCSSASVLDVYVHTAMHYPDQPPMVLLRNKAALDAELLLSIQSALWSKAQELRGDSVIFQISSYIEEQLQSLATSSAPAPMGVAQAMRLITGVEKPTSATTTAAVSGVGGGADAVMDVVVGEEGGEEEDREDTTSITSTLTNTTGGTAAKNNRNQVNKSKRDAGKRKGGVHPFWVRTTPSPFSPSTSSSSSSISTTATAATTSISDSRKGGNSGSAAEKAAMLKARQTLPAWGAREEFLQHVGNTRAMVVTGETGCGKTTQIPQYLLEAYPTAKVVVCQPRRLAAVGVAGRVAEEMFCTAGEEVGYMVRGDSRSSARTKVVFCTYGVMLRRLQVDPDLDAIDFVVLDEVHERGLDSDFTLALLMSALARRSTLKVILMSATISTDKFATYLGNAVAVNPAAAVPAPVLFIPGYTFPVTEFYKGDYEKKLRIEDGEGSGWFTSSDPWVTAAAGGGGNDDYDDDGDGGGGSSNYYRRNSSSNNNNGRIGGRGRKGDLDYDLLVRLVVRLATADYADGNASADDVMFSRAEGSVLVFMPGVPEITRLIQLLDTAWRGVTSKGCASSFPRLKVMPLHGNLSPGEQRSVFDLARRGELKVVVSTNVAEASVTIPDVTVVIDSCRVKELDFDQERQMAALTMKMASQDSLRQRRGRAGRVQAGRCFRLLTIGTYEKLPANSIPEMLRAPLEKLVLQVKSMDLSEDSSQLLRRCPDPPTRTAVRAAECTLQNIQAIAPDESGSLGITPLGRHLASLPCDPRIGRLLLFGVLLGCSYSTSAVAACLSARSPFLSPGDPEGRGKVDAAKASLAAAAGAKSDHMAMAQAVQLFNNASGTGDRRKLCRDYGLSFDRMTEIRDLQRDLLEGLVSIGFLGSQTEGLQLSSVANRNSNKPKLVVAALCAGLYPQVAKVLRPAQRFVETIGGAIERDVAAKELKLFIPQNPTDTFTSSSSSSSSSSSAAAAAAAGAGVTEAMHAANNVDISTDGLGRVFIHPSSLNFNNTSFHPSNYVLYGERQLSVTPGSNSSSNSNSSNSNSNDKAYIRDVSEVSPYPLLFFGGKLEAQYLQGTVTVDGWIRFSAPGRIVALAQALRRALDSLLLEKISDPQKDISTARELEAVCQLLATDGLSG